MDSSANVSLGCPTVVVGRMEMAAFALRRPPILPTGPPPAPTPFVLPSPACQVDSRACVGFDARGLEGERGRSLGASSRS